MARSGVDGATFWLPGAVRVLETEVLEVKGLLFEKQSDLGNTQKEMAEMYITEKQLERFTVSVKRCYWEREVQGYGRFRTRRVCWCILR